MVATRGRTFKRPWRGSCHSSKLKSSSAPIGRKDSWCFHGVGSSNAPLLGSTAAEGLQRIGRTSIATRWRFCGLPQSASCSENFVIPPDVFGQTLKTISKGTKKSSNVNVSTSSAAVSQNLKAFTVVGWTSVSRGITHPYDLVFPLRNPDTVIKKGEVKAIWLKICESAVKGEDTGKCDKDNLD